MEEKYKIENNIIGAGTFGFVYKGENRQTHEKIAIKKISKDKILSSLNESPEYYLNSLKKEIENMKKCQCENVVKFYDYFEDEKFYSIIMELCDYTLLDYIKKLSKNLTDKEIKDIFFELNNGFKKMVENKIVHRDIKLENILIKIKNNKIIPKLCDFGFSKEIKEKSKNTSLGTPNTCAPEVLEGKEYDSSVDLWSIGVIIYYCYFKKYPYNYKDIKNIIKDKTLKYEKTKNDFLNDLIDQLLKVDPNERISWDFYFNHPFFTLTNLKKFNIGFSNENIVYYTALYQEEKDKVQDIFIKAIKYNDNIQKPYYDEYDLLEKFKGNRNILKKRNIYQFENNLLYFVYECNEQCISLQEYCKTKNIEENKLKRIISELIKIFKKCKNKEIFISIFSFIANKKGDFKIIDFCLNKCFLSEKEQKIYYAPNENEIKNSECKEKTYVMNFGMTLLYILNNCDKNIFYEKNEFVFNINKPISKEFKSFLSKCLCKDIKGRSTWAELEKEDFLKNVPPEEEEKKPLFNEPEMEKAEIKIFNNIQFKALLNNLSQKYTSIYDYYTKTEINMNYLSENEDFLMLILYEMTVLKKILLNQNNFISNENVISLMSLTYSKDDDCDIKIESTNFLNIYLDSLSKIKLVNFSSLKELISQFVNDIDQKYEELRQKLLNMNKINKKYSNEFDNLDNDLEIFIKKYGKSKFQKFFISLVEDNNILKKLKNDRNGLILTLNLSKYIAECILFIKQSIKERNINKKCNEKDLINDINKVFKDENNKCILISLLYSKLRKFLNNIDDKEQKELIQNIENALEELKIFYPSIQILINSLSKI